MNEDFVKILNKMTEEELEKWFNSAARKDSLYVINLMKEAYWKGELTVDDWVYDKLVLLSGIVPEEIEYSKSKSVKKFRHPKPMLSLDKVYDENSLFSWIKKTARNDEEVFLIQPKYDGVSCHFFEGIYATRGDGNIGENITDVCKILELKTVTNKQVYTDLYGELVITKSDFGKVYSNIRNVSGDAFKNPRNAIAGILGCDDIDYYKKQNAVITLVDYDYYSFKVKAVDFETAFPMIKNMILGLDYPMDGIVVKLADKEYSESLGYTAHHPKGQMAFKFQNSKGETKLISVEWGMGKNQITATAVFEPIVLGGVTVSRAVIPTVSDNLPCAMRGDFTKGSKLVVERAGDVVPHIVSVDTEPGGEGFIIDRCPFCGSEIKVQGNSVICTNQFCQELLIQKVYYSLVSLGAKNIGVQTVRSIYNLCNIRNFTTMHFFRYILDPENESEISNSDGFGSASYRKLLEESNNILENTEENFIASLNIPNVGKKIGKVLIDAYDTIGNICKIGGSSIAKLKHLNGISDVMADRIYGYFDNYNNVAYVTEYAKLFTFKPRNVSVGNSATLHPGNKTVCFTGAMRYSRNEMSRIAKQKGYIPVPSVTQSLGMLVLADSENGTSSKCQKAKRYGITIIRENDFLQMI